MSAFPRPEPPCRLTDRVVEGRGVAVAGGELRGADFIELELRVFMDGQ